MFVATTAWMPVSCGASSGCAQKRSARRLRSSVGLVGALALLAGGWSMLVCGRGRRRRLRGRGASARRRSRARLVLGWRARRRVPCWRWRWRGADRAGAGARALVAARARRHLEFASSYAWPSWRYLVDAVLPDAVRRRRARHLRRRARSVGAVRLRHRRRRWRCSRWPRCVCAAARRTDRALRRRVGGVRWRAAPAASQPLLSKLPLFSSLRCPARALYMWTMAAPILAADGFDALAELRWHATYAGWLRRVGLGRRRGRARRHLPRRKSVDDVARRQGASRRRRVAARARPRAAAPPTTCTSATPSTTWACAGASDRPAAITRCRSGAT